MVNFTDVCEMYAKGAFVGTTRNSSSNRVKTRLGLASIAVAGALLLSGCTANEAFFFDIVRSSCCEPYDPYAALALLDLSDLLSGF